jgi:hypothetical protein
MVGKDPGLEAMAGSDPFARTKSGPVFFGTKVVENIIVKIRNHNPHPRGGGRLSVIARPNAMRPKQSKTGLLRRLRRLAMTATLRRLAMTIVGQPQRAKGFEG